ncbi:hypothetical protein VB620_07730 [Nodularia harveyana UHCC-0300]|uniref:N-acetyltransferase domain-containing protein n=1 Tax=Nodularia harveyana UHCC-0300 TaxID=2974287 RepID=A0ABU5UCG8_9CYAN|nr:hypothetical protein [Nodularia harveyana]MEA5581228.1 hypothetical protein [Nodularia harveyana UHCC-0300]
MSQFQFTLATPADDPALRQRMAQDRMEGNIALSFRREPNYFAGSQVQGETVQVIKCIDNSNGEIIALGSRLINRAFINGELTKLGYLADLRVNPDYRRGTLLARGYKYLKKLHLKNPVPLYFSLILEGNLPAIKNLTGGRAGLPQYHDLGRIYSPAIHLDLPKSEIKIRGVTFQRGKPEMLPEILAFIKQWRSQKQFAPDYNIDDFHSHRLRGLKAEDFYLAIRNNELVGTIAAWEQETFRQTHIESYSPSLARMRFFYNLLAQVTPLKPLPSPGTMVPYFYLAFVAIAHNSPEIFRALLRQLYRDRYQGKWHYFIAGLHENDPLTAVLKEYRRIDAGGRLFAIHYPDGADSFNQLDGRIPYIEIGAI